MIKNFIFLISDFYCTFFKVGFVKYMPGTIGSLIGLIIGLIIKNNLTIIFYLIFIFLLTVLAVFAINIYQARKGKEDKSEIIIDELIGQQIPIILFEMNLLNIFLSFLLFRLFDICKIYPANFIDRNYKNSFGIIGDDLIAGLQASFFLYLITIIK